MNIKFLRIMVFILAFGAFLIPGYWVGSKLGLIVTVAKSAGKTVTNCPRTEQVHLLLISADDLQKKSVTLQSAWWIIFAPDAPLQWIPLYPSPNGDANQNKKLAADFGIQKTEDESVLNPSFTQRLLEQDLCWDGYLVADNQLISAIVDDLGGITIRSAHLTGKQVINKQQQALASPAKSLAFQSDLMEELCWNALHSTITNKLDHPASNLENHILLRFSNRIDPIKWHDWNRVIKVPTCDIQTLTSTSSQP